MSGPIFQDTDDVEPIADTLGEAWGNAAIYNVINPIGGSCALTYSAGAMTVDLAAGRITHYGSLVTVAAAAAGFTLVSDPTNPRWTWLAVSSTGTPVVVSGDPAATPSVPELGDRVMVGLVYVQAGLTIASNATYKLDKRISSVAPWGVAATNAAATSTTSTSAVDLLTLTCSIPLTSFIRIVFNWRKQALAANAVAFGLKVNATVVREAATGGIPSSATNQAEDGMAVIDIAPRSAATYLNGMTWYGAGYISATGASNTQAIPNSFGVYVLTAPIPNAAITSIAIRAINTTNSNAAEIFAVSVLTY